MFKEEIEKGMALLDSVRPEWWLFVDPDTLNLNHCRQCVLGQLFGDYHRGLIAVVNPLSGNASWGYGFSVDPDLWVDDDQFDENSNRLYADLTNEWVEAIKERRMR